jgi:hypothetical protein
MDIFVLDFLPSERPAKIACECGKSFFNSIDLRPPTVLEKSRVIYTTGSG